MEKNKQIPQPIRGEKGAETKIPHNVERDRQNPDMLVPPETDHGTVPNMKFSFSDVHNRLEKGGYAREVTVRESADFRQACFCQHEAETWGHQGAALA
nr:hypothetical protein [Bacillus licheniformis]